MIQSGRPQIEELPEPFNKYEMPMEGQRVQASTETLNLLPFQQNQEMVLALLMFYILFEDLFK